MTQPKTKVGLLTVADIMVHKVRTVTPLMTIREAMHLFLTFNISGAPVIDPMGIAVSVVSQSDLMKFAAGGFMDEPLLKVMDKLATIDQLVVVKKTDPFKEVFKQFLLQPVRRVLVVDNTGKLEGIVSQSSILKAFMSTESH